MSDFYGADAGGGPTVPAAPSNLVATEAGSYSAEVQAVLDRMTALTQAEIDAIEVFVDGLVADGIWNSLDEFWCYALNQTDWLTGWKSHTATVTGSISHNKDGALCGGSAEHIDTTVDLGALTQYTLTDSEAGVYVHSMLDWGVGNHDFFGVEDGTTNRTRVRHRGNDSQDIRNSINTSVVMTNDRTITNTQRTLVSVRAGASDTVTLFDGVVQANTGGSPPDGVPTTFTMWLFRANTNGSGSQLSRSGTTLTSFYLGKSIDTVQFLSRLNTLHTALGVTP
jgi:hypothetical protein